MKKITQAIGIIFIVIAIIFLLVYSFVRVSDGSVTKDLFGFVVPNTPSWIAWIPYFGSFLYEWFSFHGLVGVVIFFLLFGVGVNLITFSKPR